MLLRSTINAATANASVCIDPLCECIETRMCIDRVRTCVSVRHVILVRTSDTAIRHTLQQFVCNRPRRSDRTHARHSHSTRRLGMVANTNRIQKNPSWVESSGIVHRPHRPTHYRGSVSRGPVRTLAAASALPAPVLLSRLRLGQGASASCEAASNELTFVDPSHAAPSHVCHCRCSACHRSSAAPPPCASPRLS